MRKQVINPETGEWAEHETAYSDGVVVHVPGGKRVFISGVVAEGDDVAAQTRTILEEIEGILADLGGGMGDVVRVRVYVARPAMDEAALETVHEIRAELFDQKQLPASTLVEVEDLVDDAFDVEIDADAFVPDDGWDVETI